ncbi:MAG: amino acid ABC transporter substrate-binding protein, partial [Acidobacteria bacterium]
MLKRDSVPLSGTWWSWYGKQPFWDSREWHKRSEDGGKMRRRQWLRMAGLLFSFALVVAACSPSDSDATTTTGEPEPVTTQAAASDVPGLVEDGKLLVVTTGNFPPYTMINEDSGDNEGYSIDLAREVADRLGLELVLPTVDFVAEMEGLASGLYDIADSGIWPNEARQEAGFVFSRPMTSTGIIAQVLTENENTAGFANVTGLIIGGIQGSSQEKFILDNEADLGYAEYLGFQGAAEATVGLRQGRVDLLVADSLLAGFAAVQNDDLSVAGPTILAHPLSFTFQEGNEGKRDAIDVVINAMIADGTVARIQQKWFGRCIPIPDDINQAEPYTTLPEGDCGTTSGDVGAGPADVPGLVEDGKLLVVTTGNFPPYTMINEDSGDNEGYSIDL